MSSLTPGMDAALAADHVLATVLIEVNLPAVGDWPAHDIRILFGSGVIGWGEKIFTGEDSIFGTLGSIDAVEDGAGDQAPVLGFTMFPPGNAAAAQLASAGYQGAPVRIWLAALSPTTGLLIPDPDLLFSGVLDQPTLKVDRASREVDFECTSDFDLLLADDEGSRLSDAFHQSIWPGETGFANITGTENTIYWGTAAPQGGATPVTVPAYQRGQLP